MEKLPVSYDLLPDVTLQWAQQYISVADLDLNETWMVSVLLKSLL